MAIFSGAAQFLQSITGAPSEVQSVPANAELALKNAYETNDLEARQRENDLNAEKKRPQENIGHKGRMPYLNQPKPKFVSHKAPTKGKANKAKKGSNRLGDELHCA